MYSYPAIDEQFIRNKPTAKIRQEKRTLCGECVCVLMERTNQRKIDTNPIQLHTVDKMLSVATMKN